VYTDKPGVQLYTGNSLDGKTAGKGGYAYDRQDGICLETQFFPNSINVDNFPSPVLKAGETYRYTTVYRFTVDS
ncbi:MAG: galactose-1-epimerase, partial [Clostridiales bacterium]|nr:galactose-1-epimerase [Clostridiales bacterium]